MRNPFRKRKSKANTTQETSAQTSNIEFPTATKVSTLEVSTSTNFDDNNRSLTDAAVNTSAISLPVSSKVSKVYVSTSAQWEDDPSRSGQLPVIPETSEVNVKDATVRTSAVAIPPSDASKSGKQSLSDRFGDWIRRKSSSLSATSPPAAIEKYIDKLVQTSYIDIPLTPKLPQLDKTTSTQEAELKLSDQQDGNTTDVEANSLKLDKPVVIFPADKPGLFFIPGITNLPLLAPSSIPLFFPQLPYPPPCGIQSLPLVQPLKQTKPTPSQFACKEASSPTASSQDIPRTLHKRKGSFINCLKSDRNKGPGEGYDAVYSCLPSADLCNTVRKNVRFFYLLLVSYVMWFGIQKFVHRKWGAETS